MNQATFSRKALDRLHRHCLEKVYPLPEKTFEEYRAAIKEWDNDPVVGITHYLDKKLTEMSMRTALEAPIEMPSFFSVFQHIYSIIGASYMNQLDEFEDWMTSPAFEGKTHRKESEQ